VHFKGFKLLSVLSMALAAASLTAACNSGDNGLPDSSSSDPSNPELQNLLASGNGSRNYSTQVMLFNGTGISTSDWQTTEIIIKGAKLTYQLVNSAQLNAMTLDQMTSFGLMIFPGGYGNQITNGLTAATRINVRAAVRERGVSFFGICAGAFVIQNTEPKAGQASSYGFALTTGNGIMSEYLPDGLEPVAAMVPVTFADGTIRQLVWWGGPITPEWTNGVIARYKTGDPAISETWAGNGFVIAAGPHTEAPQGWRATAGNDSDGLDYDIALKLIMAALNQQPLATF